MENPFGVRVVRLPKCKMVSSGMETGAPFEPGSKLMAFSAWFSKIDGSGLFMPGDFLWYDEDARGMEWWYIFAEGMDTAGFEAVDFDGGLYAAAISVDEDETDGTRVYEGIKAWITERGFAPDERPRHRTMFHIPTPSEAKKVMGFNQLDIFVPVKVKEGE